MFHHEGPVRCDRLAERLARNEHEACRTVLGVDADVIPRPELDHVDGRNGLLPENRLTLEYVRQRSVIVRQWLDEVRGLCSWTSR